MTFEPLPGPPANGHLVQAAPLHSLALSVVLLQCKGQILRCSWKRRMNKIVKHVSFRVFFPEFIQ